MQIFAWAGSPIPKSLSQKIFGNQIKYLLLIDFSFSLYPVYWQGNFFPIPTWNIRCSVFSQIRLDCLLKSPLYFHKNKGRISAFSIHLFFYQTLSSHGKEKYNKMFVFQKVSPQNRRVDLYRFCEGIFISNQLKDSRNMLFIL